jgi:microcystin-dependent protein
MRQVHTWKRALVLSVCGLCVGAAVWATTVPHTFSAGDSLSAQKMNENFAALAIPAGTIFAYGGEVSDTKPPPNGWLACNGKEYNRGDYPDLFAAIGTAWGASSDATFNVPDLRGRFLRGNDSGSGRDPDRGGRGASNGGGNTGDAIGTVQGDDFRSHTHDYHTTSLVFDTSQPNHYNYTGGFSFNLHDVTSYPRGGNETRPQNAAVNYLIKY